MTVISLKFRYFKKVFWTQLSTKLSYFGQILCNDEKSHTDYAYMSKIALVVVLATLSSLVIIMSSVFIFCLCTYLLICLLTYLLTYDMYTVCRRFGRRQVVVNHHSWFTVVPRDRHHIGLRRLCVCPAMSSTVQRRPARGGR